MRGGYVFAVEGLEELGSIEDLKPQIVKNAYLAINRTADKARTESAREIRHQVNFPGSYLNPSQGRLTVSQRASQSRLEGVISGRRRATSLARFVVGSRSKGKGLQVNVKPGSTATLARAFLMNLRGGNVGLAIRVAKGTTPKGAYKPKKIAEGLFLLYGPSVDQVFQTVREDVSRDTGNFLAAEFARLMDLGDF